MRRTKAEADQTREAILSAAIGVFVQRGVSRASLDEIARAAGVTRGAVYWHFKDKLEIFLALERRVNLPNEMVGDRLQARLAADQRLDPIDELVAALQEGLEAFESNPERCRILTVLWLRCEYVGEMLPALEGQERADAALRALFESVIGLAAARGQLAPGWSPHLAAHALLLLLNGSAKDWLREPGGTGLVARAMPLLSGFLQVIRSPKARAKGRKAAAE